MAAPTGAGSPDVLLHDTETTTVVRKDGARPFICKEYLGPNAEARRDREKAILRQLNGVTGVVRLAADAPPPPRPGVFLHLQDCGTECLADALRDGTFAPLQLVLAALRLASTLAEVHGRGIVHRDISPYNIMLAADGELVLIDFDHARLAQADPTGATDASDDEDGIFGTLAYLAPEQWGRGKRAADRRSDLYALGATLYEMATGRPPFGSQDVLQLLHAHSAAQPLAPAHVNPQVPLGISEIILRLLAKDPDDRYQSAEGLAHDLELALGVLKQGGDGAFVLGSHDFAPLFAAPSRLVGRDDELRALRDAFAGARDGTVRVLLVEGEAGVGKTALIQELKPEVAADGGRFVLGKFDQLQRAASLEGGLSQAMAALARLLLAQPEAALERQRQAILRRVGSNAALLIDAVPDFAHVLGDQARPPGLDPTQAATRLLDAMADVLLSLASPSAPLVLVLDDLQWAGEFSISLLDRMLQDGVPQGLLVVGAYRAGELGAESPLALAAERWSQGSCPPRRIVLDNLSAEKLANFVQLITRASSADARALADALHGIAAGNPFDTLETLNALRRDGVLRLGPTLWEWDPRAVLCWGTGDVVDLLRRRIAALPDAARETLECMSQLGSSVEADVLQVAAGLPDAGLDAAIEPLLEDGLVVKSPGDAKGWKFRHDRVQQAVLQSLEGPRRAQLQLAMARRLAARSDLAAHAATQLLGCAQLLADLGEKRAAAKLLADAAQRLQGAAQFEQSKDYLEVAAALAAPTSGSEQDAHDLLPFTIDVARHLTLYSLGRFDEADVLHADLSSRALDPIAVVGATWLQMRSLEIRARLDDAIALGRQLLQRFDYALPADFKDERIDAELAALGDWLAQERTIDHAHRTQAAAPRALAIAKILSRMVRSAFSANEWDALACLTVSCKRLWTEHGPCADLVVGLARCASLLVQRGNDYRTGYAVVRHVISVGETLGYEPQVFEARHVLGSYVGYRFDPIEECKRTIAQALEDLRARGDIGFSCFVANTAVELQFDYSASLSICEAGAAAAAAYCEKTGNTSSALILLPEQLIMSALKGRSGANLFGDEAFESRHLARVAVYPLSGFIFCVRRALASALACASSGDGDSGVEAAETHAHEALQREHCGPGHYLEAQAHLLAGLACARRARRLSAGRCDALDAEMRWMEAYARDNPADAEHLLELLRAEQAWAGADPWHALLAFERAIEKSHACASMWQRALIRERAAAFHFHHGLDSSGRRLLTAARDIYFAWGAAGKVTAMHARHTWLAAQRSPGSRESPAANGKTTSGLPLDAVDLMGVLNASQALSSQTSLDRLCARVSDTLAAMTGATKVSVLSFHDEEWWLLTSSTERPCIPFSEAQAARLVPLSAVSYVQRTGEAVVVDDVTRDERFSRDPYFTAQDGCSLLLAPIGGKDSLRAILILENSLAHAVFSADRLDAVKLVAGQLAVSLANAQLYAELEQRVYARTRDLRETQTKLVATARKAGMAEIANSVIHNVGNVLNSINVSAVLAKRQVEHSKSEALARVVGLLDEHPDDLAAFLSSDPRGQLVPGYLRQLSQALAEERETLLQGLDRLFRGVEHVNAIIAAQQPHAGGSNVRELVDVTELLEEAITLSTGPHHDRGQVVCDVGAVPPIPLDRSKVLQILVNLITNAWQAMEKTPRGAHLLGLSCSMAAVEGTDFVRISVRDQGEGIAADNLGRLFSQGFTTKSRGHGLGLHASAIAAIEMGGKLAAASDGPGRGSVFTLELPVQPRSLPPR